MNNVSILDCTLREGGYTNEWNFGYETIKEIIRTLSCANLKYIECGFLKDTEYNKDLSIFSDISQLQKVISPKDTSVVYALMINYGEYPISNLENCPEENIAIRVAFKKHEIKEAFEFCSQVKNKGYKVFVNPMHIYSYEESELLEILKFANEIKPFAFTIVDTTGAMKEKDILNVTKLVDKNLNKEIIIAFHSHNNMQLSLSNAQYLIKLLPERNLIIDSTLFGMGRGAGNLYTEILAQYINDNCNGDYNTQEIFKIIDKKIKPVYDKHPWGYAMPYHIAAEYNCHPNYAKFLMEKSNLSSETIIAILKQIPEDKKTSYDSELIKHLVK
jgi:4-hydroxy 2-oxovalerate aldolase